MRDMGVVGLAETDGVTVARGSVDVGVWLVLLSEDADIVWEPRKLLGCSWAS